MCIEFFLLFRLVWLLVCYLCKEVYLQIVQCVSFDYTAAAGSGNLGPVNRLTTPIEWMLSYAI